MGRREPEFAVEQRKPKAAEGAKDAVAEKDKDTKEKDKDGSWKGWLEDPNTMDRMRYFVFAQSFVMFLTVGLPQLQKVFDLIMSFFS